jgi:hypothetical protein
MHILGAQGRQSYSLADFSGLIPLYLCSGVQGDPEPRGFVTMDLSRTQHSVFAHKIIRQRQPSSGYYSEM